MGGDETEGRMGYVRPLFGSLSSKIIDFWENAVIQVVPSGLARYNDSRE